LIINPFDNKPFLMTKVFKLVKFLFLILFYILIAWWYLVLIKNIYMHHFFLPVAYSLYDLSPEENYILYPFKYNQLLFFLKINDIATEYDP